MQPVRLALGALLLAGNRVEEAELVYRADLARHPKNAWFLVRLQQSLLQQNRQKANDELAEELREAWARAHIEPVASCFCHPRARDNKTN